MENREEGDDRHMDRLERRVDLLERSMDRVEAGVGRVEGAVCQLQESIQRLKEVMDQRYNTRDLNGAHDEGRTEGEEVEEKEIEDAEEIEEVEVKEKEIDKEGADAVVEDAEKEKKVEGEETEDEEGRGGGSMAERAVMLSAPLKHADDKVMEAVFLNDLREGTSAMADWGRMKLWVPWEEEHVMVVGRWGSGMGWSRNGLGWLEFRSGLGRYNMMGFNPNTHRPNNFISQKCDDGGVGLSTQIGSNTFQQWPTNDGSNTREKGPNASITRPNDLFHVQGLVMSDPRERQ